MTGGRAGREMNAALTPDLDMARRHLTLLDADAESFVFQTFDDFKKRKDPALARVLHGTLDQHKAELASLQGGGAGVFVTVNLSKNGRRRKKDIAAYRALWREADEPNLPPLPIEPHFVIETSPGKKHEYLLIEHSEDLDTCDGIMERMVEDYGSDPCAKDRARVLRLAGFYHLKDPAKSHLVDIIHESGGLPYTLEKITQSIPPLRKNAHSKKQTTTTTSPGKYGQAALAGELVKLAGASEGERNDQLNKSTFALGQLVAGGELDRGTVEAALTGMAVSIGLSEAEARSTIRSGMEAGSREPRTAPEVGRREPLPTTTTETPSETPEAPEALKSVSLKNIEHAELDPPKYAIDQLVPVNEVTLLGGHGGTGKTIYALTLAVIYAAAAGWFGFGTRGRKVVYISLEDPAEVILYRVKKICAVYGLPYELIIQNLIILDGSDIDGTLAVETSKFGVRSISMTPLFHAVVVACEGAGLVIIDNASDAYGGNEIARVQVRTFIRTLRNRIARPNNAGVVLLAHIDKAGARNGTNENTYSGSTAWHNSVRSRLALTAKKDGTVELVQEKLNLGKKLERPVLLTWHDGVLIPDSNIAEGLQAGAQDDLNKAALLEAIEAAIADGENIPTARTGPKTTQNVLEKYPDLPSHLRGRKGRDGFYGALTMLQRAGTLTVEDYWTAARNQSQRYIVNSTSCVYIPTTLCTEPTKGTMAPSLVASIALIAGTNETHETHDKPKLWIFTLPDGTVFHTQPSDTLQEELVI